MKNFALGEALPSVAQPLARRVTSSQAGVPVQFEVARASCPWELMAKMAMPLQTEPLPTQEEPSRFQNPSERTRNVFENKGAVGKSRGAKRESISVRGGTGIPSLRSGQALPVRIQGQDGHVTSD